MDAYEKHGKEGNRNKSIGMIAVVLIVVLIVGYITVIQPKNRQKRVDELLAEKDGIAAMEILGLLKDKASEQDWDQARLYAFWQYVEQGDAENAKQFFENYTWTGTEAAQNLFVQAEGLDEAALNSLAGNLGALYTDINEQLSYCDALYAAGYDMSAVYPDGVEVDVDLTAYSLFDEETTSKPSVGKTLIFSKEMHTKFGYFSKEMHTKFGYNGYDAPNNYKGYNAPDRKEKKTWTVKLMPDLIYKVPEDRRASSWEECESLMLMEHMYVQASSFVITTTEYNQSTNRKLSSYDTTYYTYALVQMIALYEKSAPNKAMNISSSVTTPKACDDDWLNKQNADNWLLWITRENMLGQPDPEFTPMAEQVEELAPIIELLPIFYEE